MKPSSSVLLIEPDTILAGHYKRQIVAAGFNVVLVRSAQEALEATTHTVPDVIVMELMLQNHNGIELLYELQSYDDTRSVPIIVCSYMSEQELGISPAQASQLSISTYLYKPKATPKQLVHEIKKIVQGTPA